MTTPSKNPRKCYDLSDHLNFYFGLRVLGVYCTQNPKPKIEIQVIGKVVTLAWILARCRHNYFDACGGRLLVREWWRGFPGHYRTAPAAGENGCQDGVAREYR